MTNSIPAQLKEDFLVSSADVDFQQKLRLSALTNYLIQIAWKHAEMLGWGVDELFKHGLGWVLSGLQIQINEYPNWRDIVSIETWPKGINRLFYLRDYLFFNSKKEIIGRASTSWLLIDIERRRPKLYDLDHEVFTLNQNRHAIEALIPTLGYENKNEQNTDNKVRYSDVDLNHHLTTTRYIDWIFDTYQLNELTQRKPKELTVNFIKEVTYGKSVFMQRSLKSETADQFQLVEGKNEKPFFRAELRY
jgi:medium-chain acyl-[acyl-carrier-protein] hydrolase